MEVLVLSSVLGAAILHASWNAILRNGADRAWSMTLMMVPIAVIASLVCLLLPFPDRASWPYIVASALIHVAYNQALVMTYRSGELGETYPIARGASPALVTLGAALFAGETISVPSMIGVLLVSGGVVSLGLRNRRFKLDILRPALATAVLIGAYTIVDGIGVRQAGSAGGVGYASAMFLLWSLISIPAYFVAHGRPPRYTPRQTAAALTGGIVSYTAYGIVIIAMQYAPIGIVSAMRETSVLFAAIIGRFFLNEQLTLRRFVSCCVIALGAACLAT